MESQTSCWTMSYTAMILTYYATPLCFWQDLTFLEFFAGQGEVWRALRADSIGTIGVDIGYMQKTPGDQNPMDILSDAGLACGTEQTLEEVNLQNHIQSNNASNMLMWFTMLFVYFYVLIYIACIGSRLGYMFIWYCLHGSLASALFGQRCVLHGYGLIPIPLDDRFLIQKGIFAESMSLLQMQWCHGTLFLPSKSIYSQDLSTTMFCIYGVWQLLMDRIAHARNLIHVTNIWKIFETVSIYIYSFSFMMLQAWCMHVPTLGVYYFWL